MFVIRVFNTSMLEYRILE